MLADLLLADDARAFRIGGDVFGVRGEIASCLVAGEVELTRVHLVRLGCLHPSLGRADGLLHLAVGRLTGDVVSAVAPLELEGDRGGLAVEGFADALGSEGFPTPHIPDRVCVLLPDVRGRRQALLTLFVLLAIRSLRARPTTQPRDAIL